MDNNTTLYDFIDCPVVIYDDDNAYITKAIIASYDRREKSIEIYENEILEELENIKQGAHLDILIIHAGGAVEFSGRMSKIRKNAGLREIMLFNERQREARNSIRHKLNAPALLHSLTAASGEKTPFDPPLQVLLENISTTGALIKAPPTNFELNSILEIHVTIQEKDVLFQGLVTRVHEDPDYGVDLGCKFVFVE